MTVAYALRTLPILPLLAAAAFAGPAAARDAIRPVPAAVQTVPAETPAAPVAAPPPAATPAVAERGRTTGTAGLTVLVDRAKVIRLPERTQTVVIGNPAIADMAVQKNGVVVVTGKSYGSTNLIALDAAGNVLAESSVNVAAPTETVVTVQRGLDRQSYSCNPACQPSVVLGDANGYFNENRGQADARNAFATTR